LLVFETRALESRDLGEAGRLLVDVYPHRANEPPSWQRPALHEKPQRWVAVQRTSGDLVAYAAIWKVEGEKYRFDVVVSRRHQRLGIGDHLFGVVVREARHVGAVTLQARAYADAVDALAFLARRHFLETMRMRGFVLQLATADMQTIASADIMLGADVTVHEVRASEFSDSGFWRSLADLHDAARQGWPDPDPGGPPTHSEPGALRSMLSPPTNPPVGFFVASCGDRLVGYSLLTGSRATRQAQFAATGVRPDYRGRGIGTTLRARCLLAARAAGYSTVRSASGNDALVRINERFGFTETYCEVRLVRRLA
jgi:GNAT superfamily N-acetyltransferase